MIGKTLDLTPTWSGLMPALLLIVQQGPACPGFAHIVEELNRMAKLADGLKEAERVRDNVGKTLTRTLDELAESRRAHDLERVASNALADQTLQDSVRLEALRAELEAATGRAQTSEQESRVARATLSGELTRFRSAMREAGAFTRDALSDLSKITGVGNAANLSDAKGKLTRAASILQQHINLTKEES